jgi:hypothetical protein
MSGVQRSVEPAGLKAAGGERVLRSHQEDHEAEAEVAHRGALQELRPGQLGRGPHLPHHQENRYGTDRRQVDETVTLSE